MKERLEKLLNNSSSPYYNYKVAAIIECNDGKLFEGVNVETSSPAAGICAERNALYNAITNGYTKADFKVIHLMSASKEEIYPCFVCRQALYDYMNLDTKVICYSDMGEVIVSLADLCTYGFGENDLQQH
ncbi:MAG: cytidine deaminase [Bacilli bacterium]|nr:cytidine deaminase [Bacilli bacterium]